jgi:hypothetical protein
MATNLFRARPPLQGRPANRRTDQRKPDTVNRTSTLPVVTPLSGATAEPGYFEPLRRRSTEARDPLGGSLVDPGIEASLNRRRGSGAPLPPTLMREMNTGFGTDFSGVRLHHDAEAAQVSRRLQAAAFTQGTDVYFGAGVYRPETDGGRRVIAHELAHVVQQRGGRAGVGDRTVVGRADDPAERLADQSAAQALQRSAVPAAVTEHVDQADQAAQAGPGAGTVGTAVQRIFEYDNDPCTTEADAKEIAARVIEDWGWLLAEKKLTAEAFELAVVALAKADKDFGELSDEQLIAEAAKTAGPVKEEAKAVVWGYVGTRARIAKKVSDKLPGTSTEKDLQDALETREEGNVDGWNIIKKMTNSNDYELKLKNSGKSRAYGVPAADGLIEFKNAFQKGRGK